MNDSNPTILVVGYNAFDVVVPVHGSLPNDGKQEVSRITLSGGGPGATAAVALARLGARVKLVTPLTDDLPGQFQRNQLEAAGVDISRCPLRCGYVSPLAVSLVDQDSGGRSILWSRGDLPALQASEVDGAWLDGVDLLYTDGHEIAAARKMAAAARKLGLPVVMDAGGVRPDSDRLVAECSDVISSAGFAPALTGQPDPVRALAALAEMGPAHVAMTFGHAGCLALAGGRPVPIPAFAVEVVDTTGAGDAFHAGYAFARATGLEFLDCLQFGSAVAALKCRNWGGRLGLPVLSEVEALLMTDSRLPLGPPLAGK